MEKKMSDYALARLENGHEHKVFIDQRGIEPAVIYCPDKQGFTYAEQMCNAQGIYAVCGHCYEVVEI